jgi:hypothetical protein
MEAQQVYNIITTHLRKQGHKSLLDKPITRNGHTVFCAYRGHGDDKCAAGVFIPNASYKPEMEGVGWYDVGNWISNAIELRGHYDLILSFQDIHDNHEVSHWEASFNKLAQKQGLTYTPPQVSKE